MSINDTLDILIAEKPGRLHTLDSLIAELQSGTITADTGDAPVYDEATGLWTCAQSTANANGEYLGIYKLPLATLCSILNSLDIIAFSAPQSPNTPARLLPCGADPLTGWTNLPALVDLEGEEFNQFSIRSATPFEVRARVGAAPQEWCAVFLDGTGLGGFVTPAALPGFPGTHGSYDSGDNAVVAAWQGEYYWGVMRWQPSQSVTVTRIKAWLTVHPGINPSGHGIYVNEVSVQSLSVNQGGTANYQLEWMGELSASDIRISTTAWDQGSARITRVEMEWTGANPFTGRDCA